MSTPRPDGDDGRDAWLSEALRHAPDGDAAPPAALSELILREAQAKARQPRVAPAAGRSWAQRLWIWMAQPAAGAALASVMLGTVVTLMWRDGARDDVSPRTMPEAAKTVAAAPEPATAPASDAAKADETTLAAATVPASAAQGAAADIPMPAPARQPVESAARGSADAAARAAPLQQAAKPSAEGALRERRAAQEQAERAADLRVADERRAKQEAAAAPARPSEQRNETVVVQGTPDALAESSRTAEAMSPATPAVEAVAPAAAAAPLVAPPSPPPPPAPAPPLAPGAAAKRMAAPASTAPLSRQFAADSAPQGMAGTSAAASPRAEAAVGMARSLLGLRVALSGEPQRWTWQRGGDARPVDDTLAAFLADVQAAAGTRWREAGTDTVPAAPASDGVTLLQDGRAVHTLRLAGDALHWTTEAGAAGTPRHLVVPLDAVQLERLRRALQKLGP